MPLCIPVFLVLVLAACAPAPTSAEREAAYRTDLHRLVRITLTDRLRPKLAASYRDQLTTVLAAEAAAPENAVRIVDEEVNATLDLKMADLEKPLAEMFSSHFTPEEVSQLLAFQESAVGRKSMAASDEMAAESREAVQEWTTEFEAALFERLKTRFAEAGIEF
jgi:hypothetical protein